MDESMGVRGTDHARLRFERTPVPAGNRLGEEGQGSKIALGGFLRPSRISVAMSCVGLARRAHELAVEYARKRETFGKRLAQRQAIRFMIAENATDIEAARRLMLHAAREWEAGSPDAAMLSSMSKLQAVEMLTRVTDKALQIHGGIGYWQPNAIERVYRDARAQRFEEGTNEIQKTVIARALLGDPAHEASLRGKDRAGYRQLARHRSRAGANACARRRRHRRQLQPQCRSRRDDRRRDRIARRPRVPVQANLEEPEAIDRLFDRVEKELGRLDFSCQMPRPARSRRSWT